MNARSLLFVGLTLLGVHLILQTVLELPGLIVLVQQAAAALAYGGSPVASVLASSLLGAVLRFLAGLFLVRKAPSLATRMAARLPAHSSPPPLPQAADE